MADYGGALPMNPPIWMIEEKHRRSRELQRTRALSATNLLGLGGAQGIGASPFGMTDDSTTTKVKITPRQEEDELLLLLKK